MGTHLVNPQWSRHQREYPLMVDRQEDEGGNQAFLAQTPQSLEKGAEPSLVSLDDAVILVVGALLDQQPR